MSLPFNEPNLIKNLTNSMQELLSQTESSSQEKLTHTRKVLSLLEKIFSSHTTSEVFIYICEHKATTAWTLQIQLDLPEASSYRALNRLEEIEVIERIIKLPRYENRHVAGGPIPTVWGLQDCNRTDIAEAVNLHYRCISPKYRLSDEIYQSTLDAVIRRENLPHNYTNNHGEESQQEIVEVLCQSSHLGIGGEILAQIPQNPSITAKEISRKTGYKFTAQQVAHNISHRLLYKHVVRERETKFTPWKYRRIR